jgi:hypothetical protein
MPLGIYKVVSTGKSCTSKETAGSVCIQWGFRRGRGGDDRLGQKKPCNDRFAPKKSLIVHQKNATAKKQKPQLDVHVIPKIPPGWYFLY